jgi:hypothetical protein
MKPWVRVVLITGGVIVGLIVCAAGCLVVSGVGFAGLQRRTLEEDDARTESVKAQLQPLIAALDAYYADTGEYPLELSDVVPNYIDAIPDVDEDTFDFSYHRDPEDGYELSFRLAYGMLAAQVCTYQPTDGWSCGAYM